tara:strand:+ start:44 stop:370 length:327 start_codon:yes stop_codon:yes gene_type:complete
MVKFLTVTNTVGRKEIIPIHNLNSIAATSNTLIKFLISPGGSNDVIRVTLSDADPLWADATYIQEGSMVDILQKLVIEALSRGSYTDPYFDITGRIPITINNVIAAST